MTEAGTTPAGSVHSSPSQSRQRDLHPARRRRGRDHGRAHDHAQPQVGDRRPRLRLRGPGTHGPDPSPLGQLVTRVITPRLAIAERPVAGPPKRFAQGMGVAFSVSAVVLTALGYWGAAQIVLGLLVAAAFLESALGLCLGCKVFAVLMRVGVVPEEVCERCKNIWVKAPGAA